MSSYVKQITDAIELKLGTLLPTFKRSPYVWSIGKTNTKTSTNVFRIIPGTAESVDGTLRTITIKQSFTVYLTSSFVNKNTTDEVLQNTIESLYEALELVTIEAMQRRFNISRIMAAESLELLAPEIDHDSDIVSIGATYKFIYRME